MKNSKIRRTSESPTDGDFIYIDYSSLPTDSQNEPEESERFFISVQRKELTPAKKAYVESTRTKPDAPFADAHPKGLYSESGAGVVDDYAAQTDWRDRIQKAVAESATRIKPPSRETTPWPEAPQDRQIKIAYQERIFEEITPTEPEVDDEIDEIVLWEIDEKITSREPFIPEEYAGGGKPNVRADAYEQWLSERNARLAAEDAQLKANVAANLKKQKRAEAHDQWLTEREARIAAEDMELKEAVAANLKKQKYAGAYDEWLAEREARIAKEDAQLKMDVAANLKKQRQAEAYDQWIAEREARIAAEDAQLKAAVAANLKKQKYAEAHDQWVAEREARIAAEDAQLKAAVATNLKKQKYAEAHDLWVAEREARLAAEEHELLEKIREKEVEAFVYSADLKPTDETAPVFENDLKEIEDEFEAVFDETIDQMFETVSEDTVSGIEVYDETEIEIIAESPNEAAEDVADENIAIEEENIAAADENITADDETVATGEDAAAEEEADEPDEEYDADLQALLNEKKSLERLRVKSQNLDDEFVV
ncbi:hypothetical protein [Methanimicrococcus blatticola]|uniref:Uncharacterized protein n=1 Tax=Methanimicrococcus blatticola TaxID=91560 RepID=A0A484F313_9EURY|nr:hypothetical protein [Methanimicrococcus blatticola]MBZ3936055.1 hypothetical protein [Methanimicrococcus blatticola]MCC2509333.1 hypothetical protein [Methanimicrococcus blatticola]TDQ68219.1 hypothetical protein C7391_1157 [Methanimicrococcus blatticola]